MRIKKSPTSIFITIWRIGIGFTRCKNSLKEGNFWIRILPSLDFFYKFARGSWISFRLYWIKYSIWFEINIEKNLPPKEEVK